MSMVVLRWLRNADGWKRGDVVEVSRTRYVDNLIDGGMVKVIEDLSPREPAKNASRAAWAEFLTSRGHEVHPQATRRDLIDQWTGVTSRG